MQSHLQFILVKYAQKVVWNEFIESFKEMLHLIPLAVGKPVLCQYIQVLVLGAIAHPQLCSSLHQLHNLFLSTIQSRVSSEPDVREYRCGPVSVLKSEDKLNKG